MIESDAKVVDAAVEHAHAAFLKHEDATTAKRVGVAARRRPTPSTRSSASSSARSSASSASRAAPRPSRPSASAQFLRACAAQVPHLMRARCCRSTSTATGAGRFGFTTRVPYGVVAAVTPFNGPANLLIQKVAPALAVGNAVVVKPSPPGTEVGAADRGGGEEGRRSRRAVQRRAGRARDRASCSPRIRWSPPSPSPAARPPATSSRAPPARRNSSASSAPMPPTSSVPTPISPTPRTRIAGAALRGERPAMHLGAARDRRAAAYSSDSSSCSSPPRRSSRSATPRTPRPMSDRW